MSGLVLPRGLLWWLYQKIIFIKRGACCDVAVLGSISVMFPLPFCSLLSVNHKSVCGKGWFQNSYLNRQQGFVLWDILLIHFTFLSAENISLQWFSSMHGTESLCLDTVSLCWDCLCFSASQSSHCCLPALYTVGFLIRCIFVPAVFACASVWAVSKCKQLSARAL